MEFNQRGNGTPESPPNRARPRQHIQMDGADCLGVEEFWKRLAGEECGGEMLRV